MTELNEIKHKVKKVLEKHGATKAGIFGSYVRGEQRKNSDVDVLVELNDGGGLIEFIKIKNEIERAIGKKVDLVEYDLIRKELRENILKEEVKII